MWKLLLFTHYWNKTKVKYTHCEILLTSNILQLCRYCSTQQHFSPLSSELGLDSFFFQPNCALDYCPAARPSFGGFRCQTNFGIQKGSWSIQWLQEWMLNAVDAKQAQNNTQTNLLEHPLLGRLRHCVNIHLNTADQPKLPNPLLLYTWPDMLIIS